MLTGCYAVNTEINIKFKTQAKNLLCSCSRLRWCSFNNLSLGGNGTVGDNML